MRLRRSALAGMVALLVAPGSALAASAGDNQYTDPFGQGHKHHKGHHSKGHGKRHGRSHARGKGKRKRSSRRHH